MYGIDRSGSSESGTSLDPRRRPRFARAGAPGTATALRFEPIIASFRAMLASLVATLERR